MPDSTTAHTTTALRAPALLRALLLLAFGALTIFWQPGKYWSFGNPTLTQVAWATGIFLLLHGVILLILQQRMAAHATAEGEAGVRALSSAALLYALGGVLAIALHGRLELMVLVIGGVYALAGLVELLVGVRLGPDFPLGRDARMTGLITMITGMALFWFGEIGEHATFGILGSGALVAGVFLLIGVLTLRRAGR